MQVGKVGPVSGHVFRMDRRRGPQWYAKYVIGAPVADDAHGPAGLEEVLQEARPTR